VNGPLAYDFVGGGEDPRVNGAVRILRCAAAWRSRPSSLRASLRFAAVRTRAAALKDRLRPVLERGCARRLGEAQVWTTGWILRGQKPLRCAAKPTGAADNQAFSAKFALKGPIRRTDRRRNRGACPPRPGSNTATATPRRHKGLEARRIPPTAAVATNTPSGGLDLLAAAASQASIPTENSIGWS